MEELKNEDLASTSVTKPIMVISGCSPILCQSSGQKKPYLGKLSVAVSSLNLEGV